MSTLHRFLTVLFILSMAGAGRAAEAPLFRCDFGTSRGLSPLVQLAGVEARDGCVRTTTQAGWARAGVRVGPLPTPRGALTVEYDFRPGAFGPQSQEFTSESPSTHWYMLFADAAGRWNLHTRHESAWQQRHAGGQATRDTWYHARITLRRTAIAGRITERDSGKPVWEFPDTPMDDIGDETTFVLCDEGLEANAGATEWANLSVSTDDPDLKRRFEAKARELERERHEAEEQRRTAETLRRQGISLLPSPQRVTLGKGRYRLAAGARVSAPAALEAGARAVCAVLEERCGNGGVGERANGRVGEWGNGGVGDAGSVGRQSAITAGAKSEIRNPKSEIALFRLPDGVVPAGHAAQGYRLTVAPAGVRIEARTPEGFFCAAQTLAQLRGPEGALPAVTITDWPAIDNRLVMVAVSQGAFQVIDVEYWKRMIRELAAVKINRIMPYFEGGTCYYEKYPFLGVKGRDGFTREKGRVLSAYAREHFIQMIPQQESLGHSGNVLTHVELKDLREEGGTFCSSKPQVFAFLGDLYDDLVLMFPDAAWIHVGGDEFAHGFAKCPQCKARADEIGKPALYAEHIEHLRTMLAERKRKTMIWWHEEGFTEQAADKLSKDIAIFDWHYGNQSTYPSLQRLQKLGFREVWATPAVTRYYDGRDDFDNTFGNISGFLRAGARAGVPGECTCTWVHGIWGGRNLFELNYYALLYSGQCAWNPAGDDAADFRARYARHWFGLSGGRLDEEVLHAVHAPFGDAKEQGFWRTNRDLEPLLAAPPAKTAEEIAKRPEMVAEAEDLLKLCARAEAVLDRWQKAAKRNQVTIAYLRHDVRIHQTAARRILAIAQATRLRAEAEKAPPEQRKAVLAPAIASLRALAADYDQIEAMFRRSVKEAGGGEAGWGGWFPYVAKGGIQFRVQQGREGVLKLIEETEKVGGA